MSKLVLSETQPLKVDFPLKKSFSATVLLTALFLTEQFIIFLSFKFSKQHKKISGLASNPMTFLNCFDIGTGTWPNQQDLEKLILDINPNFKIKYTQLGRNILIAYE